MLTPILTLVALPWLILEHVCHALYVLAQLPRVWRARRADVLDCPVGHENALLGRWTCGCGATYLGHAFAPCTICSMPAGWITCTTCGLAIRSPWKRE